MTALSDFITEIATELDARRAEDRPFPINPDKWMDFVRMLKTIDRDDTPEVIALRRQLERIAIRRNLPFQERYRRMLLLLPPLLTDGSGTLQ